MMKNKILTYHEWMHFFHDTIYHEKPKNSFQHKDNNIYHSKLIKKNAFMYIYTKNGVVIVFSLLNLLRDSGEMTNY